MTSTLGWFKNPVFSQSEKLMAGTKCSDYIALGHYKKAKKHFNHFMYQQTAMGKFADTSATAVK